LSWDQELSDVVRKNGWSLSCHSCFSNEVSPTGALVSCTRFTCDGGGMGGGGLVLFVLTVLALVGRVVCLHLDLGVCFGSFTFLLMMLDCLVVLGICTKLTALSPT
jgi:hypothetical protein